MAALALFDAAGHWQDTLVCEHRIAPWLQGLGVGWGLLQLGPAPEPDEPGAEAWLQAQQGRLATLGQGLGLHRIDRVRVTPGQPGWPALRQQFTQEHRHSEAELRVFLAGAGLFTVRHPEGFVGLLCEVGDWVALPAGLAHSFDAGAEPHFDALRLLGQAEGWVAQPSGLQRPGLPDFDAFVSQLLEQTGYASPDDLVC